MLPIVPLSIAASEAAAAAAGATAAGAMIHIDDFIKGQQESLRNHYGDNSFSSVAARNFKRGLIGVASLVNVVRIVGKEALHTVEKSLGIHDEKYKKAFYGLAGAAIGTGVLGAAVAGAVPLMVGYGVSGAAFGVAGHTIADEWFDRKKESDETGFFGEINKRMRKHFVLDKPAENASSNGNGGDRSTNDVNSDQNSGGPPPGRAYENGGNPNGPNLVNALSGVT